MDNFGLERQYQYVTHPSARRPTEPSVGPGQWTTSRSSPHSRSRSLSKSRRHPDDTDLTGRSRSAVGYAVRQTQVCETSLGDDSTVWRFTIGSINPFHTVCCTEFPVDLQNGSRASQTELQKSVSFVGHELVAAVGIDPRAGGGFAIFVGSARVRHGSGRSPPRSHAAYSRRCPRRRPSRRFRRCVSRARRTCRLAS